MDFLLLTIGSHGDVHPFVGIGRALAARGHTVRLATNDLFRELVERAGLRFIPLGEAAAFREVQSDPNIWHPVRGPGVVLKHVGDTLAAVYDVVAANAGPGTTVVGSTLAMGARIASEKLGLAMATAHLAPICIRSVVSMPALPGLPPLGWLPMAFRQKFWDGADRWFIDPMICPVLNSFRAEKGLPPVDRIQKGWWHSPHLTIGLWPEWFFPRQSDYPEQVRLAGFPLYDESDHTPLDAELDQWLAAGEKPIAFTPGSAMLFGHRFFRTAVEVCRRLNRRGLLLTRHAEQLPADLPDTVRHVPFAPFGTLLPRCAAIVHHGGIGTTAQALRAGIPQLVMPMSHDQFDNAAICRRLGVADAVSVRRFTGRRVAGKLGRLLASEAVVATTALVAEKARGDRPLEMVCDLLERLPAPAGVA
ncbi:MAG TPA: nucleotide disphospho-sugar-binding domain-containing protein [Tepidisphaeraceae bacterium]